jgi:hypothetical protein
VQVSDPAYVAGALLGAGVGEVVCERARAAGVSQTTTATRVQAQGPHRHANARSIEATIRPIKKTAETVF